MNLKLKQKVILISLILLNLGYVTAQQNIQFTQYIFNSLSVNPAYSGYKEEWFLQTTLRSQWLGIEGAPRTFQISADGVTNQETKQVGLGLQVTRDQLGPLATTSVYGNYAYRIQMDEEDTRRLSLGLGVGISQLSIDGGILDPLDKTDPLYAKKADNSYIPDVRFGVYYASSKLYFGFSVMDLLSSSIFKGSTIDSSNVLRKQHVYLLAGSLFEMTDHIKLRPGFLIKEDFKGPTSLDLNAMFIFNNRFWVGASYRSGLALWNKSFTNNKPLSLLNSVSGIVQFQVTDQFRIGYSYDYMINDLGRSQTGTHEISIGLTIPSQYQRVLSPRFF